MFAILLPASERIKSELVFQAPSPVGSKDKHEVCTEFLRPITSMNLDKNSHLLVFRHAEKLSCKCKDFFSNYFHILSC